MGIGLLAAALLLADAAQIDCPMTSMTAAERADFAAFVAARGDPTDPRRVPFERAAQACKARHGWSDAAFSHAWNWRLTTSVLAILRPAVTNRGLRIAPVEAAIVADEALMRALAAGDWSPGAEAFVQRHDELFAAYLRGVPAAERAAARTELKDFIGMYGLSELYRTGFAAS